MRFCPHKKAWQQGHFEYGDIVKFYVGEKKQPFIIYKTLIESQTEHFFEDLRDTAASRPGYDGEVEIIRGSYMVNLSGDCYLHIPLCIKLPDLEPEVFAIFAGWLMTGKIRNYLPIADSLDERGLDEYVAAEWAHITVLAKAYLFGDDIVATPFQSAVISSLARRLEKSERVPDKAFIDLVHNNTECGSPLRRLLIDTFIMDGPKSLGLLREVEHFDFFYELVAGLTDNVPLKAFQNALDTFRDLADNLLGTRAAHDGKPTPYQKNHCVYHEHHDSMEVGEEWGVEAMPEAEYAEAYQGWSEDSEQSEEESRSDDESSESGTDEYETDEEEKSEEVKAEGVVEESEGEGMSENEEHATDEPEIGLNHYRVEEEDALTDDNSEFDRNDDFEDNVSDMVNGFEPFDPWAWPPAMERRRPFNGH